MIAAMMLLTVADVFSRLFLNSSITGTIELTEFMLICLLIGLGPAAIAGKHIRVDAIVSRLNPKVQAIIDIFIYTLCLGITAILTWRGIEQGMLALEFKAYSSMLKIPNFPFIMIMVISFAMLCLALVALLIKKILEVMK